MKFFALETAMSFLKKREPFTLLLLRCALGLVFIYHGYPKLFGSTERFVGSFQTVGLPGYFVHVAGVVEFFGGLVIAPSHLASLRRLVLVGESFPQRFIS